MLILAYYFASEMHSKFSLLIGLNTELLDKPTTHTFQKYCELPVIAHWEPTL